MARARVVPAGAVSAAQSDVQAVAHELFLLRERLDRIRGRLKRLPEFEAVRTRREAGDLDLTSVAWALVESIEAARQDLGTLQRDLSRKASFSESSLRDWNAYRERRKAALRVPVVRPAPVERDALLAELRAQGQALARLEAGLRAGCACAPVAELRRQSYGAPSRLTCQVRQREIEGGGLLKVLTREDHGGLHALPVEQRLPSLPLSLRDLHVNVNSLRPLVLLKGPRHLGRQVLVDRGAARDVLSAHDA